MSSTRSNTAVLSAVIAAVASIAVLFAVLLTAAPATAAAEVSGSAAIAVGTGKPGNMLRKYRTRTTAVKPAKAKRTGNVTNVRAPVSAVQIARTSTIALRGGVGFDRGKKRAVFTRLSLSVTARRTGVSASLGKRRIILFTAVGNAVIDPVESKLNLTSANLSLTGAAAKLIRSKLGIKRLPAGPFGRLSLSAKRSQPVPVVDPFLEQCGLAATSKRTGTVASAVPLPILADPLATDSQGITWGVRASLNGYVNSFAPIVGLDGTTANRMPPIPQVPPSSFTFPGAVGSYAANDGGTADDQAILNATGGVLYCNQAHGFRIVISNPTVVIDGANSRIIADLDTNISGVWTPTQRVDFVSLDLTGVEPTSPEPGTVVWTNVPTKLTQTGLDAMRLCDISAPGAPPGCVYQAGSSFDPITVTARVTPLG